MLKTLRITSLIAFVLAVCGVLFIVFWGLREDVGITAYLDKPGIIKRFEDRTTERDKQELESPLAVQAHAFALRIDPPPPPKPPTPPAPKPEQKNTVQRTEPPKSTAPPEPKGPVNAKFSLLATVQCESNPSRSMVLLHQTGGKDKWFWQGERVGQLDIDEVRNGSAVFSQNGRNPQVLFVPAKPKTKSLLKAETSPSMTPAGGSTSINILVDPETGEPVTMTTDAQSESAGKTPVRVSDPTRSIRTDRDQAVSTAREETVSRIRRVRTIPKPPTPEEHQASIEDSISSIQAIMGREDTNVGEEQRKQENEAWMKLLNALQKEKENLPVAEDAESNEDKTSQAGEGEQSGTNTQSGDPNEQ